MMQEIALETSAGSVLDVHGLTVAFPRGASEVRVVRNVDLAVHHG